MLSNILVWRSRDFYRQIVDSGLQPRQLLKPIEIKGKFLIIFVKLDFYSIVGIKVFFSYFYQVFIGAKPGFSTPAI